MDLDEIRKFIIGFALVSLIAAAGAIALSDFQSDEQLKKTTSVTNESVTLADTSSTVSNESVTLGYSETAISNESQAVTSESIGFTIALTYDNLTAFTELRNETADIVLGLCNVTLPTGILSCNGTNSTNLYSDYTYISGRVGSLSVIPLSSLTALRNITSEDIIGECDVTLSNGNLTCNNTHSYQAYADYSYKDYSTGGVSQSDLFVSASACRNSSMNSVILGTHCNVSGGTVTVFPLNFSDGIAYIDYSHYTPSHIVNITNSGLAGVDNTTSYFGTAGTIIGVTLLLTIVIGAFYFVTKRRE